MKPDLHYDDLMTPHQVAVAFHVSSKTVTKWAKAGKFPEGSVIFTLGGVRRYKAAAVKALLVSSRETP
jgi:predicted site-specific integrase-resolvase